MTPSFYSQLRDWAQECHGGEDKGSYLTRLREARAIIDDALRKAVTPYLGAKEPAGSRPSPSDGFHGFSVGSDKVIAWADAVDKALREVSWHFGVEDKKVMNPWREANYGHPFDAENVPRGHTPDIGAASGGRP